MRGRFERIAVLPCDDYADFVPMVRAYLDTVPDLRPKHGALAIAYPIDGDGVRMTNRAWEFSIQDVQQQLGLSTLLVVEQLHRVAMALPGVGDAGRVQVGGGVAASDGVIGLLGPGTGLGGLGAHPRERPLHQPRERRRPHQLLAHRRARAARAAPRVEVDGARVGRTPRVRAPASN